MTSKSKFSVRALVLRGVDDARFRVDAELLQVLLQRRSVRLQDLREIEKLDGERLAARQFQHAAVALAAGRDAAIRRRACSSARSLPEPSETGGR